MTARYGTVIVGGSVAGLATAEALRERGYDAPITILSAEPAPPYSRPPLSKRLPLDDDLLVPLANADELRQKDIQLLSSCRVDRADLSERLVVAGGNVLEYDTLVAATGCTARPHPGIPQGLCLRSVGDARAIQRELHRVGHAAIIGGGVLACELASASRALGVDTTLIVRGTALTLGSSGTLLAPLLERLLASHGVRMEFGASVSSSSPDSWRPGDDAARRPTASIEIDDGRRVAADLALVAIGATPATGWLDGNGLDLSDGVLCDSSGRFAPDAYAVGDVARWARPDGAPAVRSEHQTNALEQATAVAAVITGSAKPDDLSNFFWSEMFGVRIQMRGELPVGGQVALLAQDPDAGRFTLGISAEGILRGIVGWNMARAFRQSIPLLGRSMADVPVVPGGADLALDSLIPVVRGHLVMEASAS